MILKILLYVVECYGGLGLILWMVVLDGCFCWMLRDGTRIGRMTLISTDFRDSLDVGIGRILWILALGNEANRLPLQRFAGGPTARSPSNNQKRLKQL